MDDPYGEYASFPTGGQIVGNEVFDFRRPKGVEIENAVDGELNDIRVVQRKPLKFEILISKL